MSTLMDMKRSKTLTLQEAVTIFPVRQEKRDEIKKKILAKHGISELNYVPTRIQMEWQKKILDEGLTRKSLEEMEKVMKNEKMVANIAFGGNLGDYREFKKRIAQEDMDRELRLVKSGKHELFTTEEEMNDFFRENPVVSVDDAKEAHANDHGPIISTHKERGGSKTRFAPRSIVQDIYRDLDAKNMTVALTATSLQLELEPTHGMIPKPILMKIAREINNAFAEWEEQNFSKQGGMMEQKVMEPITKFCMQNAGDDFSMANDLGDKARKIVSVVGPELGKVIGQKIVDSQENKFDEDSANEAMAGIVMKTMKVASTVYEQPIEESVAYMMKVFQGILSKKK